MEKTALVDSGVAVLNTAMAEQLRAGAESYSVPRWRSWPGRSASGVLRVPLARGQRFRQIACSFLRPGLGVEASLDNLEIQVKQNWNYFNDQDAKAIGMLLQ